MHFKGQTINQFIITEVEYWYLIEKQWHCFSEYKIELSHYPQEKWIGCEDGNGNHIYDTEEFINRRIASYEQKAPKKLGNQVGRPPKNNHANVTQNQKRRNNRPIVS